MKPSQLLVDFIARIEVFEPVAYKPLRTDRWTIGYGSTFIGGKPVVPLQTITKDEAFEALTADINRFSEGICKQGLPDGLLQQEFDAVVSLVYNIGLDRFLKSDTGKLFYGGHNISDRFELYNKSGGKVVTGLVNRRIREKDIYVNGFYA